MQAYTTISGDYALRRARQAENEIAGGQYRGPLHGIPYSLKDLIDTAGIRTTYGYRSHQDFVPHRSATVHVLMEEAGGVLVGKTNSHFRRSVPVACYNPFNAVDVIVTPTCPTPASLIAESLATTKVRGREVSSRALAIMFTSLASVAGLSALSVPCGLVDDRLPVGLQIVGRRLEESLVLRVGYAYEQATQWHRRQPDETLRAL